MSMNENDSKGTIIAVSVSEKKGEKKKNVDCVELRENFGIVGDAHAGSEIRQVSLLAEESIEKMRQKGLDVASGDFAENITIKGFDLLNVAIGDRIKIGEKAVLEISQIGKECFTRCNIYDQAGDCIMPQEGVFARVLTGGRVRPNEEIRLIA